MTQRIPGSPSRSRCSAPRHSTPRPRTTHCSNASSDSNSASRHSSVAGAAFQAPTPAAVRRPPVTAARRAPSPSAADPAPQAPSSGPRHRHHSTDSVVSGRPRPARGGTDCPHPNRRRLAAHNSRPRRRPLSDVPDSRDRRLRRSPTLRHQAAPSRDEPRHGMGRCRAAVAAPEGAGALPGGAIRRRESPAVRFALPNEAHVRMASPKRDEVETSHCRTISGGPVRLELVVDTSPAVIDATLPRDDDRRGSRRSRPLRAEAASDDLGHGGPVSRPGVGAARRRHGRLRHPLDARRRRSAGWPAVG